MTTATALSPVEEIRKLQAEQEAIPQLIVRARRAGNVDQLRELRIREEILPVLIVKAKIDELRAKIPDMEQLIQEHQTKAEQLAPIRMKAEDAARKATEEAQKAQGAHQYELEMSRVQINVLQGVKSEIRQLERQLDTM